MSARYRVQSCRQTASELAYSRHLSISLRLEASVVFVDGSGGVLLVSPAAPTVFVGLQLQVPPQSQYIRPPISSVCEKHPGEAEHLRQVLFGVTSCLRLALQLFQMERFFSRTAWRSELDKPG